MRSNRHRRVTPPSRPLTACSEATRYGCSSDSASAPRHAPECDRAPTSRCACFPCPHHAGGSGSSTQSHWVSSPAGWSITANSAGVPAAAHRSHSGRSPRLRSARVNDEYPPS